MLPIKHVKNPLGKGLEVRLTAELNVTVRFIRTTHPKFSATASLAMVKGHAPLNRSNSFEVVFPEFNIL